MEKISGYDLALRVLNHPQGGVEALLRLSGDGESSWLELKAGMDLLPSDREKGHTQKDLYWNIACAVIEMINTSGGILIIGIDDKSHNAVPLQDNDPRHVIEKDGLEAYRRTEILERIWPAKKVWQTKKEKWEIQDAVPENLVEVIGAKYQDQDIAVLLVKPAKTCIRVWGEGKIEQILARESGQIGKGKQIIGSKNMEEYERKNREIKTKAFGALYECFDKDHKITKYDRKTCLKEGIKYLGGATVGGAIAASFLGTTTTASAVTGSLVIATGTAAGFAVAAPIMVGAVVGAGAVLAVKKIYMNKKNKQAEAEKEKTNKNCEKNKKVFSHHKKNCKVIEQPEQPMRRRENE